MADDHHDGPLLETPLASLHQSLGARMVPFAGYAMPVQYPTGILAEHAWTREHAGLFDVSHMGQCVLAGPDFETTARALEALVPADILGLKPGQQRYTQLLNEEGGIVDDLMVVRPSDPARGGEILLVVNAGTKEADYRLIEASLPEGIELRRMDDHALLALQGPDAVAVLSGLAPDCAAMTFMSVRPLEIGGIATHTSRSGYTGEDGYEISVPASAAADLWAKLTADERVKPVGLGARDSLRLEAGLPLYGHDINQETSPIEAGLAWSIQKRRRIEGGFPGQLRIAGELAEGPIRRRVGLRIEGRAPAREHAEIVDSAGELIGKVTSGGFAPTVGAPIAMGYVVSDFAAPGTALGVSLRGRTIAGTVVPMPFTPHRYKR
ncbi:glycine cleavage system aminomethyltransferase GcvT [Enterovirga rhinocerotis]|uniref:aminomethyltransferase n=1 Tax=Enterovirga rhinocerotis TaxID=1339210 RepID=A0A4V3DZ00_9HYPH|nr:glycine cleavage system aminomethyltransferase GcvT [Enterovirga rhinocerotis]TDR94629.1 aminomethyltransferase [Enterovirga rhinocerotis]